MKKLLFIGVLFLLFSCGNDKKTNSNNNNKAKPLDKQVNISILLDLSDRISPQKYPATPEHFQRDVEIVRTVTEYFKTNMTKLTAWKAKGKIRVFFSPAPSNQAINDIAGKLNIDCSKLDIKRRKVIYDTLTPLFEQNLTEIYNQTIQTSNWEGSDIWRFFKNDVKDFCAENDSIYRNILIILTDGYVYHKQSVYNNGNRYSYLLEKDINKIRKPNWKQLIDSSDFGLMTERKDLSNLEVLVLEVNSEKTSNKIDEDIIKYTLEKWFNEMNIAKYQIYNSDLPANTKMRIESFLKN